MHGDEASAGESYVIWSKFENDERGPRYKVVSPSMTKDAIVSWIGARVCLAPPVETMDIIFCGHGNFFLREQFSLCISTEYYSRLLLSLKGLPA